MFSRARRLASVFRAGVIGLVLLATVACLRTAPTVRESRDEIRCGLAASFTPNGGLVDGDVVRSTCERLAELVRVDDRAGWLALIAPSAACEGGCDRLRERLETVSLRELLGLEKPGAEVVLLRDCSGCRRAFIDFTFTPAQRVALTVENGRITWLRLGREVVE
jgi:hypothetical protein